MQIYITSQHEIFSKHLDFLKTLPLTQYSQSSLPEKSTSIAIDTPIPLAQINTDFFLAYKIFPVKAMTHLTEWAHEHRPMQVGDTIVQQVYLPPIQNISLKIIVGVRVIEIINEKNQLGFSYETIEGHIEKGRATFILEQTNNDKIYFRIHTLSSPAHVLARLVGPVFSVPYQTYLTRLGLNNVKGQIESQSVPSRATLR